MSITGKTNEESIDYYVDIVILHYSVIIAQ